MAKTEKDWYYEVIGDWSRLPDFLEYFSTAGDETRFALSMKGKIEDHAKKLPVITEQCFTRLQIINALLRFFEIEMEKTRSKHYKQYLEHYQRTLTSRDIDKYIDGESDVVNINLLINEISMVRNIYLSLTKGLDIKGFQLNNITKLRAAGLDSAEVE
jgi:uncharacterized membrane protein